MLNFLIDPRTNQVAGDSQQHLNEKNLSLGFESTDAAMMAGIRVRPADLARLLGVSKQAVSKWVSDGRIVLGLDGRVDPRLAINRLLSTGDPSRLRSKFLAPIIAEVTASRKRIADLEQRLSEEVENAAFHEGASIELVVLLEALQTDLIFSWPALRAAPESKALAAIRAWIEAVQLTGGSKDVMIADFLAAPAKKKEEGADFESAGEVLE
jgi:hypothetical protein